MKKSLFIAGAILALTSTTANALDISATGYVGGESSYVFRGVEQTKPVQPSSIAGVSLQSGYLTVAADAATLNKNNELELDYTFDISVPVNSMLTLGGGAVIYTYSGVKPRVGATTELYVSASLSDLAGFDLSATAYNGSQSKDLWFEVEVSHDLFGFATGYVGAASANYDNNPVGVKDGLEYVNAGLSKDIVFDSIPLGLAFDATFPTGDKVIGRAKIKSKNTYVGSVVVEFN